MENKIPDKEEATSNPNIYQWSGCVQGNIPGKNKNQLESSSSSDSDSTVETITISDETESVEEESSSSSISTSTEETTTTTSNETESSSSSISDSTEETTTISDDEVSVHDWVTGNEESDSVEEMFHFGSEEEPIEITVNDSNEEESEDTLNESDEIDEENAETDNGNSSPPLLQKEFGLLQQFKSCINQIKARVTIDQMPKNNLISALSIVNVVFDLLSIKGPEVNTNFDVLYEHFRNLEEALNISNTTSLDNSANAELTNPDVPITDFVTSSISNVLDEEYNPSTRMPLDKTKTLIPFSRIRAVRDHYEFINNSLDKIKHTLENSISIEENNALQLKIFSLITGMYIMEDFVDFVKFLSGKVTTELERSDSPTNPYSQKQIRLAFIHLDFVPSLSRKKELLETCRCQISEISNLFPEEENSEEIGAQSNEYSDKTINDKFLSLLEMPTSPTDFSAYTVDRIDNLMLELCRYNYMIEGLIFSCMDAMRAILELCCKVGNRCYPRSMITFLDYMLRVFSKLVSMREDYCEFIENLEDRPVEILLGSKIMFAKKFKKLLQIAFSVNINFWTFHMNRPRGYTLDF